VVVIRGALRHLELAPPPSIYTLSTTTTNIVHSAGRGMIQGIQQRIKRWRWRKPPRHDGTSILSLQLWREECGVTECFHRGGRRVQSVLMLTLKMLTAVRSDGMWARCVVGAVTLADAAVVVAATAIALYRSVGGGVWWCVVMLLLRLLLQLQLLLVPLLLCHVVVVVLFIADNLVTLRPCYYYGYYSSHADVAAKAVTSAVNAALTLMPHTTYSAPLP
jgi:hypothetical protein